VRHAERIFPAVLCAGVAALLAVGLLVLAYSWTVIAFPLGAGGVMCALCVLQIVRSRADRSPPLRPNTAEPFTLPTLAWVFALPVFLYALGFVAGPAIYLLVYLRASGSSWRLSGLLSVGSLVVIWAFFIKLLGVLLPVEPLWLT
jgi:hypothetical protein